MDSRDHRARVLQQNLVLWTIVGTLILGLVAVIYLFIEYRNVTSSLFRSEQLSDDEDYVRASESLELARRSWLVKHVGIKYATVNALSTEIRTRIEDQSTYQVGTIIGNDGDWDEGISRLSKISDNSYYHNRAQIAIEQFKIEMLHKELEMERTTRLTTEKEIERLIVANQLIQNALEKEIGEKLKAQSAAQTANEIANNERLAKEESQREAASEKQRADTEESAKHQALVEAASEKQRADSEESAKRQAQIEANDQKQRAISEEKSRVLLLADTNPMIQAIVAGELKFYIDPLPNFAGSGVSSAVSEIASSLSSWKPYTATVRRVYRINDADLTISWIKDYGSHTIGQSIFKSHIKIGLGTNNCIGEWSAFDANTVKRILWHEIGHSMGYGHSSNPQNVMYRELVTRFVVEQEISEVISQDWYWTFPLCEGGSYRYSFESTGTDTGFDLYVLPPGVDAAGISLGKGRVYTDCGKPKATKYSGHCNVKYGASIYVLNRSSYNAIRLSGKIISLDEPPWPNMKWDEGSFQYDDAQLRHYWNLFH